MKKKSMGSKGKNLKQGLTIGDDILTQILHRWRNSPTIYQIQITNLTYNLTQEINFKNDNCPTQS